MNENQDGMHDKCEDIDEDCESGSEDDYYFLVPFFWVAKFCTMISLFYGCERLNYNFYRICYMMQFLLILWLVFLYMLNVYAIMIYY